MTATEDATAMVDAVEAPPRRTRGWLRAAAAVTVPVAIALVAIRLRALLAGATAAEQGAAVASLVLTPLLRGVVVWGIIVLIRRRRDPSIRFRSAGLLVAIAVFAIYAAFASVRL
jgi:uncharacterized membrane protein